MTAGPRGESFYRVIGRIAAGGTAEVYHAQVEGLAGFSKHVAIKRVLPHLVENAKFIRMLLDEARLSARLNHRNIVQVFDIGRDRETYFIVMEYVEGITLADLIDHARARGSRLAVAIALHVAIEMCHALQYAHDLCDEQGRPLGVVHRDVSPGNVLLSRAGDVKLADFGMAKAESQVEKTDPGVVKGKLAYLAPEITLGAEPDAKGDQFATGIVVWEMLAGRRLFRGENDRETLARVREAVIPPLAGSHPDVPPALDAVVRRALAREPADRFPDLDAMGRALREVQYALQLPLNPQDLGRLVREVGDVASGAVPPGPGESVNSVLVMQSRTSGLPPPPAIARVASQPGGTDARDPGPQTLVIESIAALTPDAALDEPRRTEAVTTRDAPDDSSLHRLQRRLGIRPRRGRWVVVALLGCAGVAGALGAGRMREAGERRLPGWLRLPGGTDRAVTADAGADTPGSEARSLLRQGIQRRIDGCQPRVPGHPWRHVRVGAVYEGTTGRAIVVRVPPWLGTASGCVEQAFRGQSVGPFGAARWNVELDVVAP